MHCLSKKLLAALLFGAGVLALAGCPNLDEIPQAVSMPHFRPHGYLPDDGFLPGWRIVGKKRWIAGRRLERELGRQAGIFQDYGTSLLTTADYAPADQAEPVLTIESYEMEKPLAAGGIFHFHRGRILRNRGTPVDVGVEGVAAGRVVYFYKDLWFFKIIYTGPEGRQPDLPAIGRYIADAIPGGSVPPRGFEYLAVEGVDTRTAEVSSGYAFDYEFLPPAIFADAPGAGPIAKVFLISHFTEDEAMRSDREFRYFLEHNGLDYGFKRSGRSSLVWWARDPTQGRVIVTRSGTWLVGVLAPRTYEMGEVILDRVTANLRRH
jgi:hypothetical protein